METEREYETEDERRTVESRAAPRESTFKRQAANRPDSLSE